MLISLKCPQCSGDLSVEDDKDFYFCPYCGTKVVHEKPETHNHYETRQNVTNNYYGGRTNPDELFDRWVNTIVYGGDSIVAHDTFHKECYDDYRLGLMHEIMRHRRHEFDRKYEAMYRFYDDSIESYNKAYAMAQVLDNGPTKDKLIAYIKQEIASLKKEYENYLQEFKVEREEHERKLQAEKAAKTRFIIYKVLALIILILLKFWAVCVAVNYDEYTWLCMWFILIPSDYSLLVYYTGLQPAYFIDRPVGFLVYYIGFPGILMGKLLKHIAGYKY